MNGGVLGLGLGLVGGGVKLWQVLVVLEENGGHCIVQYQVIPRSECHV